MAETLSLTGIIYTPTPASLLTHPQSHRSSSFYRYTGSSVKLVTNTPRDRERGKLENKQLARIASKQASHRASQAEL